MNKRILIIEDETPILHALKASLAPKGYELAEAVSGAEGLKLALETHPDLILLDLILPEMDGMQVLKWLRDDEWGKYVPIIVITNLEEEAKKQLAKSLGVVDYVIKSDISIKELSDKIAASF